MDLRRRPNRIARTNLKVKVCFGDYLRIVLLETDILSRGEIEQMLANWDDLINSGPFRSASESAGPEFSQWLAEGERSGHNPTFDTTGGNKEFRAMSR